MLTNQLLSTHDILGGDQASEIVGWMTVESELILAPHKLSIDVPCKIDIISSTWEEITCFCTYLTFCFESVE